jgi:membrane fusion protein (multidrug efflux system)
MAKSALSSKVFVGAGIAIIAVFIITTLCFIWGPTRNPWTNDAYVTADYSTIAPKVSGLIGQVLVRDNELVKAGQIVAIIDDRDYVVAVKSAEADVASAQAALDNLDAQVARQPMLIAQAQAAVQADDASLAFARANAQRYENLSQGGAGTVEEKQQTISQLGTIAAARTGHVAAVEAAQKELDVLKAQREQAAAALALARARLDQAKLNLSYTRIAAPEDGVIGARSVRVGNYVAPGTALLALVPLQKAYVLADYREVDLTKVRAGQKVSITVDTFPGQTLRGVVDSIAPATGLTFAPIAPDNATGNFTKVVQRLAVKILFLPNQPLVRQLHQGMSVETAIHTGQATIDPLPIAQAEDLP